MKLRWLERNAAPLLPYFTLATSQGRFDEICNALGVKEVGAFVNTTADATTWFFDRRGEVCCVVAIDLGRVKNRPPTSVYALLAHEAVHVVQGYFNSFGEKKPGDEQRAYAVGNVSNYLLNLTDKPRRLKRSKNK